MLDFSHIKGEDDPNIVTIPKTEWVVLTDEQKQRLEEAKRRHTPLKAITVSEDVAKALAGFDAEDQDGEYPITGPFAFGSSVAEGADGMLIIVEW